MYQIQAAAGAQLQGGDRAGHPLLEPLCPAHCTAIRDNPACTSDSVFLRDLPLLLTLLLQTTEGSKVLFTTLQTGQEKVAEQ